MSEQFIS